MAWRNRAEAMTCAEARKDIEPYVKNELGEAETERFLAHIRTCRRCRDELETWFMIERTVEYLDLPEEPDTDPDFPAMLTREIEQKTQYLKRAGIRRRLRRVIIVLTMTMTALLLLDLLEVFKITSALAKLFS